MYTRTTLALASSLLLLSTGCTQLSEADSATLQETHQMAKEARDIAIEARDMAKTSSDAALRAEQRAAQAATYAQKANERSERMFNTSRGK